MAGRSENRFYWQAIFALLLAMCAVLFFVLIRGEAGDFHGIGHAEKTDMLVGGPAIERTGDLIWIGWIFGTLQLLMFVALLAPGFKGFTRGLAVGGRAILWGVGVLYLALFTAVMYQYHAELHGAAEWTGFPRSTWLAIFVLWPCPYLLIATYSFGFKRFIYSGSLSNRPSHSETGSR